MRSTTIRMRTTSLLAGLLALFVTTSHTARAEYNGPVVVKPWKNQQEVTFWLASSLQRIFPTTPPNNAPVRLLAARNSRISFQACLQNKGTQGELLVDGKIAGADDLKPQVRLVGFAPVWHHAPNTRPEELDGVGKIPGLVPDPLWPITRANAGLNETRSFWITLKIPADAKPGVRELRVEMQIVNGQKVVLTLDLEIAELVVQPRKDFPVIHWWRGEATWDHYKTGMFEDPRWWDITKAQLENMLDHGSDVIYVPMFFNRRETFKRPCQLLTVYEPVPEQYDFDWTMVKAFVDMSKKIGFKKFEWPHMWIYWGVENPIRLYQKKGKEYEMLWPPTEDGFSPRYINFLKQFLPAFQAFLKKEGILEDSYFHLSDEPGSGQHLVNYKRARQILRELAPWMKVMDALSDIEYGKQGLTDIPIPMIDHAQAYVDAKIPHWVYYCCAPQGDWLNRFLDTPLPKIRMSGMLFYRQGANGFLHWGFNYWHKLEQEVLIDPFTDSSAALWPSIPYGDAFVIYPGADGKPMDSIRWEIFAESLQDYAILQTAGIKRDDPMLSDIKTYANFPKNEQWIQKTMEKLLKPSTKSNAK